MNETLIGLVAATVGGLGAWLAARAQRPSRLREIIDTSGVLVDTSGELTTRLLDEIKRMDGELAECRHRIGQLTRALLRAGVDPTTINGYKEL